MENEQISRILENQGLDQKQISEILDEISQVDMGALDPTMPSVAVNRTSIENELRRQMDNETDWRKRAILAARLISNSLD